MSSAVHISLNVSDLDQSVAFYRRFFGEPTKLKVDYAKFVAEEPEIHLALQPGGGAGKRGSLSHLGIRVDSTDKVRQWKDTLAKRGLATEDEKREACCYALQEKFWVSDPDGNRWEVYTVLEDIEQKAGATTTCCQPQAQPANAVGERESSAAASCC
jgi:catechol 2,3-dioxygenase-like lactoylglutathione lyase family enzyme